MLQHLLFLRPSIEGVSVTTENIVFKLVYAVSCPLFLAFGVIFYTRVCFTDAINCVVNSSESFKVLKAIDSYCLENSYIIPESNAAPNAAYSSIAIDEAGPAHQVQAHYQYVGLFFVICGSLCYLPYVLWEWCENGLLKSLLQDLMSITLVEDEKLDGQIRKLGCIWIRNRTVLETYASVNILCEVCNLICLLLVFVLGDAFLGGYFSSLGLDLPTKVNAFPKTANCSWNTVGPSGAVLYEGVCTMNMNYLSEKLFIFAWWWLIGCIGLSILNLTYRYALLKNEDLRTWIITEGYHQFIQSKISIRKSITAEQDEPNHLLKYMPYLNKIGYGEFFMLKRIQANVPPHTFGELLQQMSRTKVVTTE